MKAELILLIAVCQQHREMLQSDADGLHAAMIEDLDRVIERAREQLERAGDPSRS